MARWQALAAFSAAVLVSLPASAGAAPGDLDDSFGSGGIVTTPVAAGNEADALATQADGKILLAGGTLTGRFLVARYTADGRLDGTFGSGGLATGPSRAPVTSIAVQPDGKILLAAGSLVRLLPEGTLDPAFGSGGAVVSAVSASAVALQPDGRIVTGGTFSGDGFRFAAARFEPDGSPDVGFGSGGVTTTPVGYGASVGDLVIQPDAKILLAGSGAIKGISNTVLARYQPNGKADQGFGTAGFVHTAIGRDAGTTSVALLPNGKILAGGWGTVDYASDSESFMAVVRYKPNGARDATFAKRGVALAVRYSSAAALAVDRSGKIVLAGKSDGLFTVARLAARGTLDRTFGSNGVTSLGSNSEAAGVALQTDGKIVAGGDLGRFSNNPQLVLARLVVTSPTTIAPSRRVSGLGHKVVLSGTLSSRAPNATVRITQQGCFDKAARSAGTTTTDSRGSWKISVRPRSRTVYRAEVEGARSIAVTLAVRPRVTLARVGPGRYRARIVTAGTWYDDRPLLLLTKQPRGWIAVRILILHKRGRAGALYVSGVTFRSRLKPGLHVKVYFLESPGDCYLPTSSKAITT